MSNSKTKTGIAIYRILSRAYFYLPFLTIFFYLKDLNIFQIEIVMSVYGMSSFITAVFIKKTMQKYLTEKKLLLLSELLKVIGFICLLIAGSNIAIYVLAQTFLGISYSLGAGMDTEIINKNIEDDDGVFQAKSNSYMFNTLLICGLIGSFLFEKNISLPILATMFASMLCLVNLAIFIPNNEINSFTQEHHQKNKILEVHEKKIIIGYAFIRGIILTIFTGFLPFYLFVNLNIPTYYFILILTSYTLVGSFSSKILSKKLDTLLLPQISIIMSLLLFMTNNIYLIIAATLLLGISSGPIRPVAAKVLKKSGNSLYGFDLAEKIYAIINILFLIIGGYLYFNYSFTAVIITAIIIYIIYTLTVLFINLKLKGKNYYENQN